MTTEQALLDAVVAAPRDAARRLVYADWLEERGDGRGELIRAEEEMQELPVFSDRYWQLKAHRNVLRAAAAPGWLEAMGYGPDVRPLFGHGLPGGWRERWRLVREYVERWYGRAMPDVGGREVEVRQEEERLGLALPPSLREWVALAHDLGLIADNEGLLFPAFYAMSELTEQAAVSFLYHNYGDYYWAVRHEDLALPDPPVHGFIGSDSNGEDTAGGEESASLTSFVLQLVLCYTKGAGGEHRSEVREPTPLLEELARAFPIRAGFDNVRVYEADNILVWLWQPRRKPSMQLTIQVARPVPCEAVPAFLWNHARSAGVGGAGLFERCHLPPGCEGEAPY